MNKSLLYNIISTLLLVGDLTCLPSFHWEYLFYCVTKEDCLQLRNYVKPEIKVIF